MTVKVFKYECMGETLSFAEGLGWVDWLEDITDDTAPCDIDALEGDALCYIEQQGYVVIYEEELYA